MENSERWYCLKCGAINGPARKICHSCGEPKPGKPLIDEKIKTEEIVLTTAPSIDGYRVVNTLDIVTAECVYGINLFRDFFAEVTDFFGGRSSATQKVLRAARETCLNELRKEAGMKYANAVIAVKLDYSEFTGKGKSMLLLVASGTAVKVEKTEY
jgi:uncharacterized protein YbjQ (UPF0145 family)